MTEPERDEIIRTLTANLPSFEQLVARTVSFPLDPWQRHLCALLQSLVWKRGQRILIHGPPQAGKSIIISQRFPAYLLGCIPTRRVRLACYNVSHATRFSEINRQLVRRDPAYREFFPDVGIADPDRQEEWSTAQRAALQDAQPSFLALGLLSGFVGQGADDLIIDDPYASPQDAQSPVVRKSVWTFWNEGARVRLNDDTNVVVMFHRYHEEDVAGELIKQEGLVENGGRWRLVRYCAEYDGDPEMPPDPLGRAVGVRLSPRMSDTYIAEQKSQPLVWAGQFQGVPKPASGILFDESWFPIKEAAPRRFQRIVRYWDIAGAEPGKGDWTVGVLMGEALPEDGGHFWILDVQRFQKAAAERDKAIKQQCELDRQAWPSCRFYIEQAPGLAKEPTEKLIRDLAGFTVEPDKVNRDKISRAEPYKAQAEAGNIRMVRGAWNGPFLKVHTAFPYGAHDDDVDAASGAFNMIVLAPVDDSVYYDPVEALGSVNYNRPGSGGDAASLDDHGLF